MHIVTLYISSELQVFCAYRLLKQLPMPLPTKRKKPGMQQQTSELLRASFSFSIGQCTNVNGHFLHLYLQFVLAMSPNEIHLDVRPLVLCRDIFQFM
jgi:hypothetical protein